MQEINLTADPLSLLTLQTPLPAPPTEDWGSFTGVLEEILGDGAMSEAGPEAETEIERAPLFAEAGITEILPDIVSDSTKSDSIPPSQPQRFASLAEKASPKPAQCFEPATSEIQESDSPIEPAAEPPAGVHERTWEVRDHTIENPGTRGQPAVCSQYLPPGRGSASTDWRPGEGKSTPSPKRLLVIETGSVTDDSTAVLNVVPLILTTPVHIAPGPDIPSKPADLVPETAIDGGSEPRLPERLNLAEFGVTRFVYKTEVEPHLAPVLQSAQMLQMVRATNPGREVRPWKLASGFDNLMQHTGSQASDMSRPATLPRPCEIQSVHLVFEPPPPPPVVRSVSMDIGDPESQVRVVIRERNGSLSVQFASANERLREDLQAAGPMLMRELQRNNPMAVTLDFSNFGSATDAGRQPRPQSRAKKPLKSDAEFADVVETAYLPGPSGPLKSL